MNPATKTHSLFYKSISMVLCFILFSSFSFAQAKKEKKEKDKLLDGKTFIVQLTEQGGKKTPKPINDELSFKTDKLKSKAMMEQYKFPAGAYTAMMDTTSSEKAIIFDCESSTPSEETIHWTGTITDEAIEGTATITKNEKVKKEFAYSGTLKVKKK